MKLALLISRLAIIALCAASMSCSSVSDFSVAPKLASADALSFGF